MTIYDRLELIEENQKEIFQRLDQAEKNDKVITSLLREGLEQFTLFNTKLEEIKSTMNADLFERTGEHYEFTELQ